MQVVQNQISRVSCWIEYFVRSQCATNAASLEGCLSCWMKMHRLWAGTDWSDANDPCPKLYLFAAASRALIKSSRLLLSIRVAPVSTKAGTGEYGSAFQF